MSDTVYTRELPTGGSIVGWSSLALVAMCAVLLALDGFTEEGLRALIHATARTSLVFFAAAFAASGLRRICRALHVTGPWVVFGIFTSSYLGRALENPNFVPHAAPLAAMLILRLLPSRARVD